MYWFLYFPLRGWRDKGEDGEGCFQELSDSVVVREASFKRRVFLVCVCRADTREPARWGCLISLFCDAGFVPAFLFLLRVLSVYLPAQLCQVLAEARGSSVLLGA